MKMSTHTIGLSIAIMVIMLLPPLPAHSQDRNEGLGPKVCKLYNEEGYVMSHIGHGCHWTMTEGRKLVKGETAELSIYRNPPPEVVKSTLEYHNGYMDMMKKAMPEIEISALSICSQGKPTGRKMVWHQPNGMLLTLGYAICDGHLLSGNFALKSDSQVSSTALFDELMFRAVPLLTSQ